jgi:hypothetical protein
MQPSEFAAMGLTEASDPVGGFIVKVLVRGLPLIIVSVASVIGLLSVIARIAGPLPESIPQRAADQIAGSATWGHRDPLPLGKPLEIEIALSAIELGWGIYPAIGDIDGDGHVDLLIGGAKGRMLVYRGMGTATSQQFAEPVWFDDLCAGGRIPVG